MSGVVSKLRERRGDVQLGASHELIAELADLAPGHMLEALAVVVRVLNDPETPGASVVAAANAILDLGHGKPRPAPGNGGDNFNPIQVSYDDEIDAQA